MVLLLVVSSGYFAIAGVHIYWPRGVLTMLVMALAFGWDALPGECLRPGWFGGRPPRGERLIRASADVRPEPLVGNRGIPLAGMATGRVPSPSVEPWRPAMRHCSVEVVRASVGSN